MKFRTLRHGARAWLLAGTGLAPLAAHGQEAPAPAPAASQAAGQRIEVKASRDDADEDRRDALAARIIVSREQIARHGDSTLADVLRRVPGITVSGDGNRGAEIRLRGMGSGYTQMLLGGEPVPRGFSLESLSPGQIERIEISRVATVDVSAQAIAGTINIILRQAPRRDERELMLGASRRAAEPSYTADAFIGSRDEAWSWGLGLGATRKHERWPALIEQRGSDAAGTPTLARTTRREASGAERGLSLTPKLNWQPGPADKLGAELLLRQTHFDDSTHERREATLGAPPPYAADDVSARLRTALQRARLNWARNSEGGASTELRLGVSRLRRDGEAVLLGYDALPQRVMDERVSSSTTERGTNAAGKLRLPYVEGHAVALGWDAERGRRGEDRVQRQSSPTGRPTLDLDESYSATVTQAAVYLQDEWDAQPGLALYAGLRHAALRTRTEGRTLEAAVANRAAVTSPVLQLLWKPQGEQDALRAGLSRTYRAPRTRDLVPRRWVANDNTPTTPDIQGNAGLRPELAWGLDLGWEHFLPRNAGLLGASFGLRRIRDVIVDRLSQDSRGWVSTRLNDGNARVQTLELESRLRLRALWPAAPDAELRAAAALNRSHVDSVPGPDNRLDTQVPASLNLGLDWRPEGVPLTLGGSLAWQQGVRARTSLTQGTRSANQATLDLYALWKLQPGTQLRLGVANALHRTAVTDDSSLDTSGLYTQRTEETGYTTVRLTLELKL